MMFPIGTTISILKLIDYKNIEIFCFEEDQCVWKMSAGIFLRHVGNDISEKSDFLQLAEV